MMKIDGRCHCGAITFEAEADPAQTRLCNCSDCQRLSGAPFRLSIAAESGTFRLLAGEPTTYVKIADSGAAREHGFCSRCGAPIYSTTVGDEPKVYNLRVGALNQRDQLAPKVQIWARSQQPWVNHIASIPKFETQP
jgi:hypothetical protein